ncbi:MAG: methyltransferase domain-containing protein [Anaerolineales bacterium]|nr:MAG: methyltransferase domain-containing protein [Anaerolineales bacterium]
MTEIWAKLVGAPDDGLDYWGYWGVRMVEHAEINPGAEVLDSGTGDTGSSLFPAAEKVGEEGRVVGIDICKHCVGEAILGVKKRGVKNAFISEMNAEKMGFEDTSFDFVLAGFMGWDYCYDFQRGEFTAPDTRMAEIFRVIKDGGRVVMCTWEKQSDIEWMRDEFSRHLPGYVADHEKAEGELPLVYSKETSDGYREILKSAGFKDIEIIPEEETFVNTDEEAWWEMMGRVGWQRHFEKAEEMGDDKLSGFKAAVFEDLQSRKHDDGIHFTKAVAFAMGRK